MDIFFKQEYTCSFSVIKQGIKLQYQALFYSRIAYLRNNKKTLVLYIRVTLCLKGLSLSLIEYTWRPRELTVLFLYFWYQM